MHLIGNMWFLWIFGDNIEHELGHFYYLFFYPVCGLAALVAHFVTNPLSDVPTVGASGTISGVMGAYMIRFPWARVVTLVPILIIFFTIELPAVVLLAYWFFIQFMSGAADFGTQGGGLLSASGRDSRVGLPRYASSDWVAAPPPIIPRILATCRRARSDAIGSFRRVASPEPTAGP